mgnify:CR=1 FL=1
MTGFLKRLFGSPANQNEPPAGEPDEVYKEVEVFARPVKDGGQWRIAGTLKRTADGASAKSATLGKARLIIDQNGASLWSGEDRPV